MLRREPGWVNSAFLRGAQQGYVVFFAQEWLWDHINSMYLYLEEMHK